MPPSPLQNPHLDGAAFDFSGGPTGVLLLHGFGATPVEVRWLGTTLHQYGYTVVGPQLPGHGTTIQDINRCHWRDWVQHVERAYQDLAARCARVFVGGESMGGLLTLYLGSDHPEIAGLLTFAPALRIANRQAYLAPLLKPFIKQLPKKRGGNPNSVVNQRWQGYTMNPVPALAQLLNLQRQVRRRLSHVRQPLLVLQGRQDTTLDPNGAQDIIDRVGSVDKTLIWLDQSTHCLLLDIEREAAAERTLAFIQRVTSET